MSRAAGAKRILFPLLALLVGCALAVGVAQLTARLFGLDLQRRIHRLKLEYFPPEPTGLQIADSTLGWTNRPGAIVHKTAEDFDVFYHVDEWEGRLIPGRPEDAPIILVLGGSFTFGQGIEDHETYAAVLQERYWGDFAIRLRASNGWGTAQAYTALSEDLERGDDIRLALYGWLPFHNGRNHLSEYWLGQVERADQRLPHFSVRDGWPVFEGLIGPEAAQPDGTPEMTSAEWRITKALVRAMHRTAREHDARFVVVFLPFEEQEREPDVPRMAALLEAEGIEFIRPRLDAAEYARGLRLPVDGHPNARWHALVAEDLARQIAIGELN